MKRKITEAGQPCRHCGTPVVRQEHAHGWTPKPGRTWYSWWFKCRSCRAIYMVGAAANSPQLAARENVPQAHDDSDSLGFANRLYLSSRDDFSAVRLSVALFGH